MVRKENFTYYLSVEGETEKYYFEHLRDIINADPAAVRTFVLRCDVEKNPLSYAKRKNACSIERIAHICDYESKEDCHVRNFTDVLENLVKAREIKRLDYKLGYSNFTFELWMVLHMQNCCCCLTHRSQYLAHVNKAFNEEFAKLDEYKREDVFKRCLKKIGVNEVRAAVERAETILAEKEKNGIHETEYKKFSYFTDNPSMSIHKVVKEILDLAYKTKRA
ncbi:MAG: RloB domain-containing protein [Clostridia bacterium]|jgi:hypothetical protein|nr:RloB domain-containing protein [Clostridia bacterium]